MAWYEPGDELDGGWRRLEGSGPSDWPRERTPRAPVMPLVPQPTVDAEPEAASDDPIYAPWPDAPQQPIIRFAREVLRFDPWPRQEQLLNGLYHSGVRQSIWLLGRRSGKDRMAGLVGLFEAVVSAEQHLAHVPPGERVAVAIIATSRAQAAITHRFVTTWLRQSLPHLIAADRDDELELTNGVSILTLPCTSRAARGYAIAVAILTECAHFVDADGSPLALESVLQAVSPATAQFPAGRILMLSSPRWNVGTYADLARRAASGVDPTMRVWWAPTWEMNPTIPASFFESEQAKDPVGAAREYGARLSGATGAVLPDALVRAAVFDFPETGLTAGRRYTISVDFASGTGRDAIALVAGSRVGEVVEVREVRTWAGAPASPVNHAAVMDEIAALSRELGGAPVVLDQWAGEVLAQQMQSRGCHVVRRAWTNENKVESVTVTRQLLHQQRLRLPRHSVLISELVQLEQRLLPSGRVRIAAPPGAHDDAATALLALCHHIAGRRKGWAGVTGSAGGVV